MSCFSTSPVIVQVFLPMNTVNCWSEAWQASSSPVWALCLILVLQLRHLDYPHRLYNSHSRHWWAFYFTIALRNFPSISSVWTILRIKIIPIYDGILLHIPEALHRNAFYYNGFVSHENEKRHILWSLIFPDMTNSKDVLVTRRLIPEGAC